MCALSVRLSFLEVGCPSRISPPVDRVSASPRVRTRSAPFSEETLVGAVTLFGAEFALCLRSDTSIPRLKHAGVRVAVTLTVASPGDSEVSPMQPPLFNAIQGNFPPFCTYPSTSPPSQPHRVAFSQPKCVCSMLTSIFAHLVVPYRSICCIQRFRARYFPVVTNIRCPAAAHSVHTYALGKCFEYTPPCGIIAYQTRAKPLCLL